MAGLAPVELTADCSACGLEGGVVEIYDAFVAACRFGVPATTRCKLCSAGAQGTFDRAPAKALHEIPANRCPACLHELGPAALDERRCPVCNACAALQETIASTRFDRLETFEQALDAWADRELFPSRRALIIATFVEHDIAVLFAAVQRKERLAILADPFANMGVRTTSGDRPKEPASPKPPANVPAPKMEAPAVISVAREPIQVVPPRQSHEANPFARTFPDPAQASSAAPIVPPLPSAPPPPPSAPPRAIVFPLVSVIAADGEIHPEERALVDRFLQSEGLAPLADHEFAVHHPAEVAHFVPRERREEVVKLMCETAAVDGMPDESERRVIRAYATAWQVEDEKLDFWMWGYETMNTSLARQLFLKLRRFVLSARWGEPESKE